MSKAARQCNKMKVKEIETGKIRSHFENVAATRSKITTRRAENNDPVIRNKVTI